MNTGARPALSVTKPDALVSPDFGTSPQSELGRRLATLSAVASSVCKPLGFQHVLNNAIEDITNLMGFDAGCLFLTNGSSGDLSLKAHHGLPERLVPVLDRLWPDEEFFAPVLSKGQPLFGGLPLGGVGVCGRHLPREGFRFFFASPLKAKGDTLGVMILANRRPKVLGDGFEEFLESVGEILGMAIENATLHRYMAELLQEVRVQTHRSRETERQLQSAIDNANDAMAIIQDGRFKAGNAYGLEMMRYSAEEARELNVIELVHPDYREMVRVNYLRRLVGDVTPPFDILVLRKDGTEIPVNLTTRLIEYEGRPAIIAVAKDLTDPRHLSEQVIHSEQMAALGQLVSRVGQELNNPLKDVIGHSQLLLLERNLPEALRRGIDAILQSARSAGRVVDNLLAFSRERPGSRSQVNINDLLERTLALCARGLSLNNVEVNKDWDACLPRTVGDAHQLEQVFLNLVVNAKHAMYSSNGRGSLSIRSRVLASPGPRKADQTGEVIEIVFADDGPGIPADHLDRIFEPLFTTKPEGQGAGLGLSISRRILQEHGGRLHARSRPGYGATFVIELPVMKTRSGSFDPPPAPASRTGPARKRFLVIDDDPVIVRLLQEIVRAEGFSVDAASNGEQALRQLEIHSYDLVFCDINMPRMNGRDFYREVQRQYGDLAERIIFVTGDSFSDENQEFFKRTSSRFIQKPFEVDDIVPLLLEVEHLHELRCR